MNFDMLDDPAVFVPSPSLRARVISAGRARRRRRRGAVVGSAGVAVAAAVAPMLFLSQQADQLQQVDLPSLDTTAPSPTEPAATAPPPPGSSVPPATFPYAAPLPAAINVLVVGVDTRPAGSDVGGSRTDAIAVVRVDPTAGRITVVSVPRDLFVPIDGGQPSRINAALADGRDALIRTVASTLDAPINHYLEVDFDGFTALVDLAGGVDIPFQAGTRDLQTGFVTGAGCIHLDGATALAYARSRYLETLAEDGTWQPDPRGDLGRIERQQDLAHRLYRRVLTSGFGASEQLRIVTDVLDDLTVDSELGVDGLRALWATAAAIGPDAVDRLDLADLVHHEVILDQSVLVADPADLHARTGALRGEQSDDQPPAVADTDQPTFGADVEACG